VVYRTEESVFIGDSIIVANIAHENETKSLILFAGI
jgi:quinolinate synthase